MVHHGLDYTPTWNPELREIVCFNSEGFLPVTPQIYDLLPKTMI
jgi:hypothetical protein